MVIQRTSLARSRQTHPSYPVIVMLSYDDLRGELSLKPTDLHFKTLSAGSFDGWGAAR